MGETGSLRVLHMEDDRAHAELIRRTLAKTGLDCDIRLATTRAEYLKALEQGRPDLILSDSHSHDIAGLEVLQLAHGRYPQLPFIFVSGTFDDNDPDDLKAAGADACVLKSDLDTLAGIIQRTLRMRHSATDFRRLFEASPDVLLVLLPDAPQFTMVAATEARLSATHTTREQTIGRGLFELFPDNPDDPAATGTSNLRASLQRVLDTKIPDTMAVQKYDIRGPDGSFQAKYWSPKNLPVLSESGEILYILHRVEDVTELVHASEVGEKLRDRTQEMEREVIKRSRELADANHELRDANVKLGELDAAKTAFFSNVSHEFRTPLTLLLGPVEDALAEAQDALPAKQRKRLELVHYNALRLLKLVNALLDFSRIEAGRMQASFSPTDIAKRTRELANAFHSAGEKAGLRLSIDCGPLSMPAYVDQEMWEKIVLNLVSNAFKFTFEGGIAVQLREDDTHFRLSVRDTGTGIPKAELPHLFERFHRVQGAKSRGHEGTGIGLSLVRELVKLHGGTVSAESTLGKGTAFTVSIPKGSAHLPAGSVMETGKAGPLDLNAATFAEEAGRWLLGDQAQPAAPSAGQAPAPSPGTRKARILLADDNTDLRAYMTQLLEPYYQVDPAVDGEAALARASHEPPDLVLSDVMMPRLDGFGLLRGLKSDPRTRNVPVILLSARAGEEASIEGLDAGADDYLVKPFSARELLARVRTHLGLALTRRQWMHELEQANRELEAFSSSVSHDLRAPLRSISGFSSLLMEEYGDKLDDTGRNYLNYVTGSTKRMSELIEDLIKLAHVTRMQLTRKPLSLTDLARKVAADLRAGEPGRSCTVEVADGLMAQGDARLVAIALDNLLGNAWKFTSKRADAHISVGSEMTDGVRTFYVRDNGAGFNMDHADGLFAPFRRMHSEDEFQGTGIGLATVQRVIARHGGRIWVEAHEGKGATFHFTLGDVLTGDQQ